MEGIGADAAFMAAAASKAFLALIEPQRLMFLALGCLMGLVLGIVPGIGGLTGTAMLLPFTFAMDPYSAFALLLGLGATTSTGDPIPAILFGVPGGAASAATVGKNCDAAVQYRRPEREGAGSDGRIAAHYQSVVVRVRLKLKNRSIAGCAGE